MKHETITSLGIARILLGQRILSEYGEREKVPPNLIFTYDQLGDMLNKATGTGYRASFHYLWKHREIYKDYWNRRGVWKPSR